MYTFDNFIDRIAKAYNDDNNKLSYRYFPEDRQLWINDKCSYLEISDNMIRMTTDYNDDKLNKVLENFYDLEGTIKKRNMIIYTFKWYLLEIQERLQCTEELYERAKKFSEKMFRYTFPPGIRRQYNQRYIKDTKFTVEIYLRRDNNGYYYYFSIYGARSIVEKVLDNKDEYNLEIVKHSVSDITCIIR